MLVHEPVRLVAVAAPLVDSLIVEAVNLMFILLERIKACQFVQPCTTQAASTFRRSQNKLVLLRPSNLRTTRPNRRRTPQNQRTGPPCKLSECSPLIQTLKQRSPGIVGSPSSRQRHSRDPVSLAGLGSGLH